jgi:hypothetical protein
MVKQIPLTRGFVALVDDEDYERISTYRWHFCPHTTSNYANTAHDGTTVGMHRIIMNAKSGEEVDHINYDGLDNRRSNLRICLPKENKRHRGKCHGRWPYKGVGYNAALPFRPWSARIRNGGKQIHLGNYATIEEAARAYDSAALQFHKQFAALNFPCNVNLCLSS